MKNRMLSQDIVKGLAMLVVIQLHALQLTKEIFYPLVAFFGFIMPVFVFFSGYNYHSKGLPPVQLMKQRVGALLKIYFTWAFSVFLVMGLYFLIRKEGTPMEILRSFGAHLLSESGCKMLGIQVPIVMFQHVLAPYWFLQYLITASILFYLTVDHALKSFSRTFSTVTLLVLITFVFVRFDILLPWGFHCAPALAAIMIIAARLARDNRFFATLEKPVWTLINSLVCLLIVDSIQISHPSAGILGAGLLGEFAGTIEVFFLVIFAVFGSYLLINVAKLIEKIPYVSSGLVWFGQHSLEILLLHRPIAYVIRDLMKLPHFVSGDPLYIDKITLPNLIAFLLVFVFTIPMIILLDRFKAKRKAGNA